MVYNLESLSLETQCPLHYPPLAVTLPHCTHTPVPPQSMRECITCQTYPVIIQREPFTSPYCLHIYSEVYKLQTDPRCIVNSPGPTPPPLHPGPTPPPNITIALLCVCYYCIVLANDRVVCKCSLFVV